jgi:quercetin dioxygenase-like cupin family protein
MKAESVSPFLAIPMKYALARLSDGGWASGPIAGLQQRDLLLRQASSGQMGALHMRAVASGSAAAWGAHLPFRFLYVTSGALSFRLRDDAMTLAAGDTALTETLALASDIAWSADFEAVEITAPAAGENVNPEPLLAMPLPTLDQAAAIAGITRDTPDAYKVGNGPRRYFKYRDLGVIDATDRRIHIHQVSAVDTPEGGTGWHIHSMSQLFYVFSGWVDINIEGQGLVHMEGGDAMCICADMGHNVAGFSADYDLIEVCLPADYSTKDIPAPQ